MLVKLPQMLRTNKIDKPIAYITLILDITRQIEKVIRILKAIIDLLRQLLDRILVGYISNHNGCPCIVLDVLRHHQVEIPLIVRLKGVVVVVTVVGEWLEEV